MPTNLEMVTKRSGVLFDAAVVAFGIVMVFVAVVFSYPVISRYLSPEDFAKVGLIFFINSSIGLLDITKAVVIKELGATRAKLNLKGVLLPIGISIFMSSLFLLLFWKVSLSDLFHLSDFIFCVAAASVVMCLMPLWGVLEANGKVAMSSVIRATSNAALYVGVAVVAVIYSAERAGLIYLITAILSLALMMFMARRLVAWQGGVNIKIGNVVSNGALNIGKFASDALDRLMISKVGIPQLGSAYISLYEVVSKSHVAIQLLNQTFYPRLCKGEDVKGIFLGLVSLLILSLAILSALSIYYGESVAAFYLGEEYREFGGVLSFCFALVAMHSMSLPGQALLRSKGKFLELSAIQYLFLLLSVLFVVFYWAVDPLIAVLVGVVIARSAGFVFLIIDASIKFRALFALLYICNFCLAMNYCAGLQ